MQHPFKDQFKPTETRENTCNGLFILLCSNVHCASVTAADTVMYFVSTQGKSCNG